MIQYGKILLLLSAMLTGLLSISLAQSPAGRLNLKLHYGFIMRHSSEMGHLANQRPLAIEAEYLRQTDGKKEWHKLYNHPLPGFSLHYYFFDPHKPIGNLLGAYPHFNFIVARTAKTLCTVRLGTGLGVAGKRFSIKENHKDNLISTRINYVLTGRINLFFSVKNWNINTGIGILHFSNGAIKVPNLGINIPSVHLGIGRNSSQTITISREGKTNAPGKWVLNLSGAAGLKEIYPVGGRKYILSTISAYGGRQVSGKSTWLAGADFFYDPSEKYIEYDNGPLPRKNFKAGINVGHELAIGKLALLVQAGYYIYKPLPIYKKMYQRYALKYYITPKLFGAAALKTHFGKADYVEWTLGIRL